jgi:hypothetical protein
MITLVLGQGLGPRTAVATVLIAFQVAAGMLLVVVSATTSLAGDRALGDWDVLLSSPLSTRSIVLGKWWGAYRGVPWVALPAALAAVAIACRSGRYAGVALVLGLALSYGAAVASLGLSLATWVPQVGRAATLGVAAHVLVTVGWFFLILVLTPGTPGLRGPGLGSASPFIGTMFTLIGMQNTPRGGDWSEYIAWIVFWIAVELAVAFGLLAATLATFERCTGRVRETPWVGRHRAPLGQ